MECQQKYSGWLSIRRAEALPWLSEILKTPAKRTWPIRFDRLMYGEYRTVTDLYGDPIAAGTYYCYEPLKQVQSGKC